MSPDKIRRAVNQVEGDLPELILLTVLFRTSNLEETDRGLDGVSSKLMLLGLKRAVLPSSVCIITCESWLACGVWGGLRCL